MRFKDIQGFITGGNYEVTIPLDMLEERITKWVEEPHYKLNLNPDFQRGHVWTESQQVEFVEFFLREGKTRITIYFNNPDFNNPPSTTGYHDFVIVDGLQRLTALRKFMANKLKVLGLYLYQFEGKIIQARAYHNLKFNINTLQTRKDVLNWYLEMNTGGTVHSESEIVRVKALLKQETHG